MARREKPTLGTVLAVSVLPVAFLAAGCAFLVGAFRSFDEARRSARWPTASAVIETSQLVVPNRGSATFRVVYAYSVAGRPFRSARVALGSYTGSQARRWAEAYPLGSQVLARYDPADPRKAVLESRVASGGWLLPTFGTAFLGVGLLLGRFFYRALRRGELTS